MIKNLNNGKWISRSKRTKDIFPRNSSLQKFQQEISKLRQLSSNYMSTDWSRRPWWMLEKLSLWIQIKKELKKPWI